MKRVSVLAVLMFLSVSVFGQVFQQGKTYANSQTDTSSWQHITARSNLSLVLVYSDSLSATVNVDFAPGFLVTTSLSALFAKTVTVSSYQTYTPSAYTATAAGNKGFVLRGYGTNNIPGCGDGWIRTRTAFAGSANGVVPANPTYTEEIVEE